MIKSLKDAKSEFQKIKEGYSKDVKYDEYKVTVQMPPGLTPEDFLKQMSEDLNKVVNNKDFDDVNIFKKTKPGPAEVGSIYDINIWGLDDGSVILVSKTPSCFTFQTIETPYSKTGTHPENGARNSVLNVIQMVQLPFILEVFHKHKSQAQIALPIQNKRKVGQH